ncbi:hypothetical protein GCM10010383_52540 [Streptomyces lomondensis]|uniref:Uncharacterized protein n=1 Tax=Streptomyces lomondensis TaxID=68229 RepID=A0ABQ2XIE5_9ACTN|nr:hypothetical protein GCM10010383_52540 [Streptomyces lomondensis]
MIVGGIAAYALFQWLGVAYYLLAISWVAVTGAVLFFLAVASHAIRYVRDVLIPDMRRNRLIKTYNRLGGQTISPLNVHSARVVAIGLVRNEADEASLPPETTFDGIPLSEVMRLRSRTFYLITTKASIELWERHKASFLDIAWFDKELVDYEVHSPYFHSHTMELRFPEGTFIRLAYGAT